MVNSINTSEVDEQVEVGKWGTASLFHLIISSLKSINNSRFRLRTAHLFELQIDIKPRDPLRIRRKSAIVSYRGSPDTVFISMNRYKMSPLVKSRKIRHFGAGAVDLGL